VVDVDALGSDAELGKGDCLRSDLLTGTIERDI
jgi:hypothetical protein